MPYRDLQHFIEVLEQKGRLKRIKTEVSQDLEIAEISDRTTKKGGPALLFENVKGHTMPVAINLFGSRDRMALALDVDALENLPERLGSILALAMNPPTGGFLEKIKTLPKLMEMASFMPKTVDGGLSWRLPRIVGMAQAQRIIFEDPDIDADEAHALGIIHQVIPQSELVKNLEALVEKSKLQSRGLFAKNRKLLLESQSRAIGATYEAEAMAMKIAAGTPDGREGIEAFIAKRPPKFTS
ncbi:MAG: UbiD family decarboxylase [Planctomycetes bacterium]|nr:UbiD family decarboxylase [Planctomycetota bacterium]